MKKVIFTIMILVSAPLYAMVPASQINTTSTTGDVVALGFSLLVTVIFGLGVIYEVVKK